MLQSIDKSKPVMVSGATGYIAGLLVKRLLTEGITVHAPIRNHKSREKTKYLNSLAQQLPGTIRYFEADLLIPDSYDEAMQGCELVFHTASPFTLNVKDAQTELINPALKGTRNVLESANRILSVRRIVLTSSIAAMYGDNIDISKAEGGILNESEWNFSSSLTHQPYSFSKTLAEKEAWKIFNDQNRWSLVVINPAFVLGPGINPQSTSESFSMFKQIANGTLKYAAPNFNIGMVDVRDVAEAHYLAGYNPKAKGRHILCAKSTSLMGVVSILRSKYKNDYPFPKYKIPKSIIWLFAPWIGFKRKMIKNNIDYPFYVNNYKSINELGIRYRSFDTTVLEYFEQLVNYGIITKSN
jgi:dihydroflavonol-4-reductase